MSQHHTKKHRKRVWRIRRRWGGPTTACVYCGRRGRIEPDGLQLDHFVPVAAGGLSEPSNLVPACQTCNDYKGKTVYPSLDAARRDIQDMLRRFGTLKDKQARKAAYAAEVARHTACKRLAWALLAAD